MSYKYYFHMMLMVFLCVVGCQVQAQTSSSDVPTLKDIDHQIQEVNQKQQSIVEQLTNVNTCSTYLAQINSLSSQITALQSQLPNIANGSVPYTTRVNAITALQRQLTEIQAKYTSSQASLKTQLANTVTQQLVLDELKEKVSDSAALVAQLNLLQHQLNATTP